MFDRGAPEPASSRNHPQLQLKPPTRTITLTPTTSPYSSPSNSTNMPNEQESAVAAAAAEIESEGERIKMEHEATFLVRQMEAIEMTNNELRRQTKKLEADSSSSSHGSSQCPLTTVSFSPNDDESLVSQLPATPSNNNPTTTTRPACLADDLSTIYYDDDGMTSTPGAANTASQAANVALIQQLQQENARLRDCLLQCNKAVLDIRKNADLKVVRLEWEIVRLRQHLADESALNSKYITLNQSLRRQLQHVADHIVQNKNNSPASRERFEELKQLHQRELVVEKQMNELIHSRNQAIRDNTALKRLLLGTCFHCRQRLPVKRKEPTEHQHGPVGVVSNNDGSASSLQQQHLQLKPTTDIETKLAIAAAAASQQEQEVTTTSSSIRPTYQTSARTVLDNLPKQPVAPNPSSVTHSHDASLPLARPKKSCLKGTTSSTPSSPIEKTSNSSGKSTNINSSNYSPRTTTALLIDTNSTTTTNNNSMRKSLMAHRFPSESHRNQHAAVTAAAASSRQQNARVSPGTRFRRRALDAVVAEPKTRRASTGGIAPAQNNIRSGRHAAPLARTSSYTRIVVKSPSWRKQANRSCTSPTQKAKEPPHDATTDGKQPKQQQQQQKKQLAVKGLIHTTDQHSNELSSSTKFLRHPPALERIEF